MEDQQTTTSGFNLSKKTILSLVGVAVLLAATGLGVYLAQQKQLFKPKAYETQPVSAPETSFNIYPVSDRFIYEPGYYISEPRILVQVKSDIAAANLFVAKLKFPANLLEVIKVDTSDVYQGNTFIKNWVETTYDNNAGTISIIGGVPAPGFQTQQGDNPYNMVHIIFKPKAQGVVNIDFSSDSAIYRNSDNADILDKTRGATFTIVPNPTVTVYPTSPVSSITPTPAYCGDLALKKPVKASGYWEDGNPEKVVDGDLGTSWRTSESTGAWWYVDLGSVQTIDTVKLSWGWDDRFGASATSKISVGLDGKNWTGVAQSVRTKSNNARKVETLQFSPVQARYVRFYATQWDGGWADMQTFEAYGSGCQGSVTPTPAGIPGDVNRDNKITLVDMSGLLSRWGMKDSEAGRADLNNDGVVNSIDYSMMINILVKAGVIKGASDMPPTLRQPGT